MFAELFAEFLEPRLELEEAYWSRNFEILAAPQSLASQCERDEALRELGMCRAQLDDARTQRGTEALLLRIQSLPTFFERNGILADLCQ